MSPSSDWLRVLSRPAFKNRHVNPYNASINDHLAAHGVHMDEYHPFQTWVRGCDIVHVHWPETTFNHDLPSALVTTEALLHTLQVARRKGGKVLWTAHNVFAHDRRHPAWERRFWNRYLPLVDGWIALTTTGRDEACCAFPALTSKPSWVLPHPHYRGLYKDSISREEARKRLGIPTEARALLFFGNILEYKNVPELIHTFRRVARNHPDVWLVVAGRPLNRRFDRLTRDARGDHPRIQLHLRYIPDGEVQTFFRASDRVILPYCEVTNSGAALLALSFDRPVLMPAVAPTRDLRDQTGDDWVHLYERWSDAALEEEARQPAPASDRTDGAHLKAFDPRTLAEQTAAIYRTLVS